MGARRECQDPSAKKSAPRIAKGCRFLPFSARGRPGGSAQSSRGHGHVRLDYELVDLDTGEVQPFLSIAETALLAPPAARAYAHSLET
jgi:hypothetical protein